MQARERSHLSTRLRSAYCDASSVVWPSANSFRLASGLESLSSSGGVSGPLVLPPSACGGLLAQGSTPISRAAFIILETDERYRPTEFDAQLTAAFDELSTQRGDADGDADDALSGLLGSRLLTRPAPAATASKAGHAALSRLASGPVVTRRQSSISERSTVPPGVISSGVAATDLEALMQRLLEQPISAASRSSSSVTTTVGWLSPTGVRMQSDISSVIVSALLEDATAAAADSGAEGDVGATARARSSRGGEASSRTFGSGAGAGFALGASVRFGLFRSVLRDLLALRGLFGTLVDLLIAFDEEATRLTGSEHQGQHGRKGTAADRWRRLQSSGDGNFFSAGDVIDLLRLLSRAPPARTSRASTSTSSPVLSAIEVGSVLASLRLDSSSFRAGASVLPIAFVDAVVLAHLATLRARRRSDHALRARRVAEWRAHHEAERERQSAANGLPYGSLDADTVAVYRAAFHTTADRHKELPRGATPTPSPYEDVETVEYS